MMGLILQIMKAFHFQTRHIAKQLVVSQLLVMYFYSKNNSISTGPRTLKEWFTLVEAERLGILKLPKTCPNLPKLLVYCR